MPKARTQRKAIDPEDLIDIPGGSKLAFVSRHTLENWLSQGVLTRFKIGPGRGRTLISRKELISLIRVDA